MKKKLQISSEAVYLLAAVILSFATAMLAAADFGLSMVVTPAYAISIRASFLTFGQAEYLVQGSLFVVLCIVLRKVRLIYLVSFGSGLIYGAALDFWRAVLPWLNPEVTAPGSFGLPARILIFTVGFFLNSFGVTLYFKTYFYPQVYEFFVKGVSRRLGMKLEKFKICYDMCSLAAGALISLLLLHRLAGIGLGTVIMACCNGVLVGKMGGWLDKHISIQARFPKLEGKFVL